MEPETLIPFTKMSGAGNDFIIIDHRTPFLNQVDLQDLARVICERKFSVGADGLILIENSETADFCWKFFNADGSIAEMCGNGARCAARFAYHKKIAPAGMRFMTLAGIIEAEVLTEGLVKIRMTPPANIALNRSVTVDNEEKVIHFINTGVPHIVHFVDDIKSCPVFEWGRFLRNHEIFQPAGANVNFVAESQNKLYMRTYERGVENETLACGTGAVASAIIATLLDHVSPPVEIITSGGDRLVVHFVRPGPGMEINEIFLEGPANFIYEGRLHAEALPRKASGRVR